MGSFFDPWGVTRHGPNVRSLAVWMVICFIVAVVGAIVVYFMFLSKKNEKSFTGFLGWLYDFLDFKKLFLEGVLKVLYIATAAFLTLYSLVLLFSGQPGSFLMMLVLGNVVARVMYEIIMLTLIICRNTSDISKKMGANTSTNIIFESEIPLKKLEIICEGCGTKLKQGMAFCSTCGKATSEEQKPEEPKPEQKPESEQE